MTVDALIASVVLQIGLDLLARGFAAGFIEDLHAAAGHFSNIALFKEDKATGHRQERQLIGGDEVFAHPEADYQRATGTGRQQSARIAGIHDDRAVGAAQLRNGTQYRFAQRAALRQLPVHQVGNHFGIRFGDENVPAGFQFFAQRFVVFDNTVVHHHNVF